MGLSGIVAAARASEGVQKRFVYKKPKPRFIDADDLVEEIKKKEKEVADWRTCKYLKEQNGCFFCTYFIAKCAKEKCNQKYIKEKD